MNILSDQAMAQWMLETRKHGYTARRAYRFNASSWLYFGVVLVAGICALAVAKVWIAAWFLIGIAVGTLTRDYAWINTSRTVWPLYVKVIDWERVEQLADPDSSN